VIRSAIDVVMGIPSKATGCARLQGILRLRKTFTS
jgi:hypothetical protein